MQEIESLLNLKKYKIIMIADKKEDNKNVKISYISDKKISKKNYIQK